MRLLNAAKPNLIDEDARVLVALSGGPDSCALLLALCELADAGLLPRPVGAAHYHHGLRGADADTDAAFAAALCTRLGLPCIIEIGKIVPIGNESLYTAARRIRYDFLIESAHDLSANAIATGHNRNDQAETVLGRVLRGASVDGLAGIPARRTLAEGVDVIRPLLTATRAEIEAYCTEQGIVPRIDPSNAKDRFTRSRLRKRLPELAAEFNPQLTEALVRLGEHARRDGDLLGALAEGVWSRSLTPLPPLSQAKEGESDTAPLVSLPAQTKLRQPPMPSLPDSPLSLARDRPCAAWTPGQGVSDRENALTLHLPPLRAAHPALRGRVLIRAIRTALGESLAAEQATTLAFVERLETLIAAPNGGSLDLPGGLRATCAGEYLTLVRVSTPQKMPVAPYEIAFTIPGEATVDALGLQVTSTWRDADTAPLPRIRHSLTVDMAYNAEEATGPVFVLRSARAGDRIAPLGMGGRSRLVRDLLREAGVPAGRRESAPLVMRADTGEIVWVVGIAQAESTRVADDAVGQVVRLQATREFQE